MDICIFYKHHFSVRNKKETIYYSDEERKVAIEKLKPKPEITVLKVWERFHQMSLKILLEKLFVDPVMMDKTSIEQLLSFYMGKKYARPTRIYHQEFEGWT
jgi:topoisomerase-4 subunit B